MSAAAQGHLSPSLQGGEGCTIPAAQTDDDDKEGKGEESKNYDDQDNINNDDDDDNCTLDITDNINNKPNSRTQDSAWKVRLEKKLQAH